MLCHEGVESIPDLITHLAEFGLAVLVGTLHRCGIFEGPMQMLASAGENRAQFHSVIADRDDVIELLPRELINGLRPLAGNVDANLAHDDDCFRTNCGGASASRIHLETITGFVA